MPHPIQIMLAKSYKAHTRKTPAMCVSHRGHLGRIDIDVRILNIGTKGAVTGWTEDAIASFFGRDIVGLDGTGRTHSASCIPWHSAIARSPGKIGWKWSERDERASISKKQYGHQNLTSCHMLLRNGKSLTSSFQRK